MQYAHTQFARASDIWSQKRLAIRTVIYRFWPPGGHAESPPIAIEFGEMRLLILGGTMFLGRQITELARARGHIVTLFNRALSNPGVVEADEYRFGDRDDHRDGLNELRGSDCWDAVIDTSGFYPSNVEASCGLLAGRAGLYCFVSSLAVIADEALHGQDETAALIPMPDDTSSPVTSVSYGGLKAACEEAVSRCFPDGRLILRPGIIAGPYDPSSRLSHWLGRIASGDRVLTPPADQPVQILDVRDLAHWIIRMLEQNHHGIFNTAGPMTPYRMIDLLESCRTILSSDAKLTPVSEEFLLRHGVRQELDLPLWVSRSSSGLMNVKIVKALEAGLEFRPLEATVRDTFAWSQSIPDSEKMSVGLSMRAEAALLDEWDRFETGGNFTTN